MTPPSTKPEVTAETIKGKSVETWYLGQGTVIHNSTGCAHEFIQVASNRCQCQRCGLGVFGHVVDGKLTR